jgi:hypothetical protein
VAISSARPICTAAKCEASGVAFFAPGNPPPGFFGKVKRRLLGRDRLMPSIATAGRYRTATSAPWLRWQRFHPGRPQAGGGLDADDLGKADLHYAVREVGIVAVSGVGQRDLGFDPRCKGGTKLVKRDLRVGLEDDIVGHACGDVPVGVISPLVR